MTHTAVAGSVRKVWRREERERLSLPLYSLGEEIFSAVSHGAAALFGVAALVVLLVACRKTPVTVASVSVFGATMILLYTVSTLYHALNVNRAKRVFRVLDHCTIYLLIAGTYTPITLCCLGGTAGLVLLCAVWGAGVLGIVLNAVSLERFKSFSLPFCWIYGTVHCTSCCGNPRRRISVRTGYRYASAGLHPKSADGKRPANKSQVEISDF